jgi:hypothetical protein
MKKRFWCCALMTLLSAGVSAGFSLAGLLGSGSDDSSARYAASRSVALLLTILIAIRVRSRMAIAFLGIAMTVVQAFDGVIGALDSPPSQSASTIGKSSEETYRHKSRMVGNPKTKLSLSSGFSYLILGAYAK